MSHYCTAVFHDPDSDAGSLMEQYSYDNAEYQVFVKDYSKQQAEKLFKKFQKANKNSDFDIETFMQEEYNCYHQDEEGNFGNEDNPNGLYDWCEVGGRWRKILYPKLTNTDLKEKYKLHLKELQSNNNLKEYVRIKMMSPLKYCLSLTPKHDGGFGETTIDIKELDIETTLLLNSSWKKIDKFQEYFSTIICEEQGIIQNHNRFMSLLKYWKKRNGCITIVDYHL